MGLDTSFRQMLCHMFPESVWPPRDGVTGRYNPAAPQPAALDLVAVHIAELSTRVRAHLYMTPPNCSSDARVCYRTWDQLWAGMARELNAILAGYPHLQTLVAVRDVASPRAKEVLHLQRGAIDAKRTATAAAASSSTSTLPSTPPTFAPTSAVAHSVAQLVHVQTASDEEECGSGAAAATHGAQFWDRYAQEMYARAELPRQADGAFPSLVVDGATHRERLLPLPQRLHVCGGGSGSGSSGGGGSGATALLKVVSDMEDVAASRSCIEADQRVATWALHYWDRARVVQSVDSDVLLCLMFAATTIVDARGAEALTRAPLFLQTSGQGTGTDRGLSVMYINVGDLVTQFYETYGWLGDDEVEPLCALALCASLDGTDYDCDRECKSRVTNVSTLTLWRLVVEHWTQLRGLVTLLPAAPGAPVTLETPLYVVVNLEALQRLLSLANVVRDMRAVSALARRFTWFFDLMSNGPRPSHRVPDPLECEPPAFRQEPGVSRFGYREAARPGTRRRVCVPAEAAAVPPNMCVSNAPGDVYTAHVSAAQPSRAHALNRVC